MMRINRCTPSLVTAMLVALAMPGIGVAQSARSVPVSVQNLPEVQAVEDISNPAFQPYQTTDTRFTAISSAGVTLLTTGIDIDPVPAGKRLVVQHLSYRASGADILNASCSARVRDGFSQIVVHPLPMQLDAFRDDEVYRVSIPITMYADPGHEVGVACNIRTTDDVSQEIGVTGYFIDL